MHDSRCTYEQFEYQDPDDIKVLSTRFVKKTRKPWRCDMCGKIQPAGSSKNEQYNTDGHDFWTFRWCTTNCILEEHNDE